MGLERLKCSKNVSVFFVVKVGGGACAFSIRFMMPHYNFNNYRGKRLRREKKSNVLSVFSFLPFFFLLILFLKEETFLLRFLHFKFSHSFTAKFVFSLLHKARYSIYLESIFGNRM